MKKALELVESCDCDEGCPSCVGPPDPGQPPIKDAVTTALNRLAFVN
jgi:ATP-dependent helicase YprA (DUF1998 family)